MTRVLFVCLGNICRSPTAQGVFEALLATHPLAGRLSVDSCGTGAWHVGKAPDPRAIEAAASRGYTLSHLRARQIDAQDFERFDYLLAMDQDNLDDLRKLSPSGFRGHLGLFLDYASGSTEREVPDPYYGGSAGFDHVLDLVEEASRGLLDDLSHANTP
ncbi:MAG: low molecular weight protein-tyrosine-phosphatase [Pseudomonadota bacterium]